MNYILAVFKSRYATLNFANFLKLHNIPVAIINTPNSISRTCGISVKFLKDFFPKVKVILSQSNLNNFDGFYSYIEKDGRVQIIRI